MLCTSQGCPIPWTQCCGKSYPTTVHSHKGTVLDGCHRVGLPSGRPCCTVRRNACGLLGAGCSPFRKSEGKETGGAVREREAWWKDLLQAKTINWGNAVWISETKRLLWLVDQWWNPCLKPEKEKELARCEGGDCDYSHQPLLCFQLPPCLLACQIA